MSWLYSSSSDNSSRFVLGSGGLRPLVCVGLNPSTASPTKLDQTLARVANIASLNGYDGFLMLNVYPLRATKPGALPASIDAGLKAENERQIASAVAGKDFAVWAAWGALISIRPYLAGLLLDIFDLPELQNCNWYSRGQISKDGHPHHPLYLRNDHPLVPFDLVRYRTIL